MRKKDLNNLELIKNKFDNNIPNIPPSLSEDSIRYKIMLNTSHRKIKFRPAVNYRPIVTAAACFVLILGIVFASVWYSYNSDKVTTFGSYDELNSKITELDKCHSGESGAYGGPGNNVYKKQENGVEIPSTVQTDGEYIYYSYYDTESTVNRNKVYIFKIENGSSSFVSVLDRLTPDMDTEDDDSYEIRGLFVYNNRLVIIMDKNNPMLSDKYKRDFNTAVIKIYDITDRAEPSLLTEFEQSGEYFEARMIDNTLFVATNYEVGTDDGDYTVPSIKQDRENIPVQSKDIICFENVKAAQYAVISTIDVNRAKQSENTRAFLGGSPKIYCTSAYIYINEYVDGERFGAPERDVTSAMKINLEDNKVTYASAQEINAYSNVKIDLGKGSSYAYNLYPVGEYFLCIGEDLDSMQNEIILYDKSLNVLDSMPLGSTSIMYNSENLAFSEKRNVFAFPMYFADETSRNYGVITLEIQNNKIVITNEFKNADNGQSRCVITDEYVYSFAENHTAPDNERLTVFANKY